MKYTAVQLPRDRSRWPQTLFFYGPGRQEPSFKFTRASRSQHWVGHGFYAMSRDAVEKWVESGAQPLPGRAKRPANEQLDIAREKVATARAAGHKKIYVTPALLDALISLAEPQE
jgi:hypothetical protein